MARCEIKMPDEFLEKLTRLGNRTDDICEKALEAGGEVVLSKVKGNLAAAVGRGTKRDSRSTGELEGALGLSPAKVGRDGNHNIKIGFAEPRAGGGSNAKIANILEYGRHGQAPRPFLKPAKSASKVTVKSYKDKTHIYRPVEDWTIFEDAHPAVIEQEKAPPRQ